MKKILIFLISSLFFLVISVSVKAQSYPPSFESNGIIYLNCGQTLHAPIPFVKMPILPFPSYLHPYPENTRCMKFRVVICNNKKLYVNIGEGTTRLFKKITISNYNDGGNLA